MKESKIPLESSQSWDLTLCEMILMLAITSSSEEAPKFNQVFASYENVNIF